MNYEQDHSAGKLPKPKGLYDTQKAIGLIKTISSGKCICMAPHLEARGPPLFVMQGSGLNDDLNGVERPVAFDVPA